MTRLRTFAAFAIVATVFVTLPPTVLAAPGDAIVPGAIRVDATYENIGVVWEVAGDINLNSSMSLEFRKAGTTEWLAGAMAVRAYPSLTVNGSPLGLDQWGASAMFLESGTDYDLRLTITDPEEKVIFDGVLPAGSDPFDGQPQAGSVDVGHQDNPVNPRRRDLLDAVADSKLPIRPIEELKAELDRICGRPAKIERSDEPVAVVKWVDGTILDTVWRV